MADKELSYRLVIRDDGTPVLRKVAIEAEKTGAAVTSAQAKAAATTVKPPQFPMSAQMKANADFWMGPAAKAQEESMKKVTGLIKEQAHEASSLERTMERIQRTVAAFVAVWAFQKITQGISAIVNGGMEFNAIMEESKLGMSAIFMAQGNFVNSSGRALQGTDALNSAMAMSSEISKQLQLDNLKTAATYQQLVKAYQQTIAPGLAVGFDPEQIRNYTVGMVQAASALGLNLDMLAEETRSMLKGAITPRNTLIATALGIRNEDINRYKGDVDGLYKYIMGRLSAFGIAGEAVQMTWKGAMSNVKDVIQMTLGEGFTNLFEYLKKEALNLQKSLVKWDIGGPKLDQEVVSVFRSMGQAIIEIIEGTKIWINSLSGLVPIFGLIYQLLRSIFIILNPIVEFFGSILSLIGYLASGIASAVNAINNLLTHSKALQVLFSAIVTILVGSILAVFYPIIATVASWGAALVGVLAIIGLIAKTLGVIGDGFAFLVKSASETDWLKNMGTSIEGTGFGEIESSLVNVQENDIKFKARAIELDKDQKEELMKIVAVTGELTDIDRRRMTVLNETSLLYKDSYNELNKQIDLLKGGFDFSQLKYEGASGFFDHQKESLEEVLAKIPLYSKDMADLTRQEQQVINKIASEREKSTLPPDLKNKLFAQLEGIELGKIKVGIQLEVGNINAQIASQNKEYDKQRRLIDEITNAKIRQLKLNVKESPELENAIRKEAEQQKKQLDIQQQMEKLGWANEISNAKAQMAGIVGDLQTQLSLEKNSLEITIAKNRAGLKIRDASQLEAESQSRIKFNMEAIERIEQKRLDDHTKILELESRIAIANDDIAGSLDIKKRQAELVTRELNRQLNIAIESFSVFEELGGGEPEYIRILRERLRLLILGNEAEDKRRRLESGFSQTGKSLQFQTNIAEMTGDWNASKLVEKELLQLELSRALTIEGLSADGKKYAEISIQMKTAEVDAQRTLNQAQLYEIGMKQFAFKLNQDLADQYANKIPNAINLSVGAFGTFLESIGSGTKTIGESFRSLFSDIGKGILKLLIDLQMAELKLAIMKSLGFGGGASLISMGASLLSPGTSGTTLPGKAGGGPVFAGNAYWVGERGPEIFSPKTSGSIIPNSAISGSQNVKIQIVNESGAPIQAKSSKVDIKPDEYIISVVIDAANRNRMGLRDVFSGG